MNNLISQENTDIQTLTNSIANQVSKEASDYLSISNQIALLLGSKVGTTTNPFQPQIDSIKSSQLTDETNISSNTANITSLTSSVNTNTTNISNLQSSNSVNVNNISNLTSGLNTANNNIANNLTTLNNAITLITTLSSKEQADISGL